MSEPAVLGCASLDDTRSFLNFIEAIKVAENAAHQIAFMREQGGWLQIENALAAVRKTATDLATRGVKH